MPFASSLALLVTLPTFFVEEPGGDFSIRAPDLTARFTPARISFELRDGTVTLEFEGASKASPPTGTGWLQGTANFFTGADPRRWRTGAALYSGVRYPELYPGIELRWGAAGGRLKSEFVVAPGADYERIRFRYRGALAVALGSDGSMEVDINGGRLREGLPLAYQDTGPVGAQYRLLEGGWIGFALDGVDRSRPLVIDPTVSYSSYFGGARSEVGQAVAVDSSGNVYVAGWTDSLDLPLKTGNRAWSGSADAFVFKLNPAGNALLYATYVGGRGDDRALAIAVDPSGNAFLAGSTASSDFPVAYPLQAKRKGGRDAFVTKLGPSGETILYSSYYGGSSSDAANGIAVDSLGDIYVGGETASTNFPVRYGYQNSLQGTRDGFLLKLTPFGGITYGTYFGGGGDDRITAVAVSSNQTPFVAGCTGSANMPTAQPAQTSLAGAQDAFVARLTAAGTGLVFSTYWGGTNTAVQPECAYGLDLDVNRNAYITGVTGAVDFPRTSAYQAAIGGGGADAFAARFTSQGVLVYSTFLGGRGVDAGTSIKVDSSFRAYITGYTSSSNFPMSSPLQGVWGGVFDGFLTRLAANGLSVDFSTYWGGSGAEQPFGLALDGTGGAYVTGLTSSPNFPLQGAVQAVRSGSSDAFVTKFSGF